ncbi:hypothetical protein HPP92_023485 [Vanilla planifolia]|uniref:non-specific serine/threonine protein kinase n=1 Tax=Vanilla planifolia TaxID=51239 RepID=A0A835PT84_VANPL|nr:hypothetical protein HPP92_023485 [Vanilla planifolia]
MWMLKSLAGKEHPGLEGRVIEIGNTKIRVQNAVAEGGFSCVYLAHDALNISKQYALKHMICQDGESLELAMKEIQVMKVLKGHPNVVTLIAHSIYDMGRRKEVMLVMDFCEKSLVNVLESRGAVYYEEKQALLIFRDVCNAVFALHTQSPPIAHRDLKAENVLLGSDGVWKLCDFGSTSTNHKCFDKPEEMGIEEDNIRKHTTPAYRAPEMWDLYRREVICEKVDIWALGCLLYRICYFKSAFLGDSKLQILNGSYRIPDLPKYSASLTALIKDMLEGSPDARPDITQVWFRVNELLPMELQKHMPEGAETESRSNIHTSMSDVPSEGTHNSTPVMPKRRPPPPPSREMAGNNTSRQYDEHQHAKTSHVSSSTSGADGTPLGAFWSTQFAPDHLFNEEQTSRSSNHGPSNPKRTSPSKEQHTKTSPPSRREYELEAQVEKLKEQLKTINLEKAEAVSKYEKLSAICRSQRQEIHELRNSLLMASTPPLSIESSTQQFDTLSPVPEPEPWQAFSDEPKPQSKPNNSRSVRTGSNRRNSTKHPESTPATDDWGFGVESFTASPSSNNLKKVESNQPAGWAGF